MPNQEESYHRHKKWCEYSRGAKIGAMAAAALVFVPALLALFGGVTMWLWNWLMPAIFNLPAIGFWQAVGILILAQLLFKGGHVRRAGSSSWKKAKIRAQMSAEVPPSAQSVPGKEAQAE
ncbi:MAG TPA: hypothetical protein VGU63_09455 [Candidatus Acidoferrales bacterium]|nr:hypothetical protein [Candidatus Acidoferrales bacterium]